MSEQEQTNGVISGIILLILFVITGIPLLFIYDEYLNGLFYPEFYPEYLLLEQNKTVYCGYNLEPKMLKLSRCIDGQEYTGVAYQKTGRFYSIKQQKIMEVK